MLNTQFGSEYQTKEDLQSFEIGEKIQLPFLCNIPAEVTADEHEQFVEGVRQYIMSRPFYFKSEDQTVVIAEAVVDNIINDQEAGLRCLVTITKVNKEFLDG